MKKRLLLILVLLSINRKSTDELFNEAVMRSDYNSIVKYINKGANVNNHANNIGFDGETALINAAYDRNFKIVNYCWIMGKKLMPQIIAITQLLYMLPKNV